MANKPAVKSVDNSSEYQKTPKSFVVNTAIVNCNCGSLKNTIQLVITDRGSHSGGNPMTMDVDTKAENFSQIFGKCSKTGEDCVLSSMHPKWHTPLKVPAYSKYEFKQSLKTENGMDTAVLKEMLVVYYPIIFESSLICWHFGSAGVIEVYKNGQLPTAMIDFMENINESLLTSRDISKERLKQYLTDNFYASSEKKYKGLVSLGFDPLIAVMASNGIINKHNVENMVINVKSPIPNDLGIALKNSPVVSKNIHLDMYEQGYSYIGNIETIKLKKYISLSKHYNVERNTHVFAKLLDETNPSKGYVICKFKTDTAAKAYYKEKRDNYNKWDFISDSITVLDTGIESAGMTGIDLPIKQGLQNVVTIGAQLAGIAEGYGYELSNIMTKEQMFYRDALHGANNLSDEDNYYVATVIEKYTHTNPYKQFDGFIGKELYVKGKTEYKSPDINRVQDAQS